MTPAVQLSQIAQWVTVLEVRCFDPRRKRINSIFAGNYCEDKQGAMTISWDKGV